MSHGSISSAAVENKDDFVPNDLSQDDHNILRNKERKALVKSRKRTSRASLQSCQNASDHETIIKKMDKKFNEMDKKFNETEVQQVLSLN